MPPRPSRVPRAHTHTLSLTPTSHFEHPTHTQNPSPLSLSHSHRPRTTRETHWRDHKFPNFRLTTLNHIIRMAFDYNIRFESATTERYPFSHFVLRLVFLSGYPRSSNVIKIFFFYTHIYSLAIKFSGWVWGSVFLWSPGHIISPHFSPAPTLLLLLWDTDCHRSNVEDGIARPDCIIIHRAPGKMGFAAHDVPRGDGEKRSQRSGKLNIILNPSIVKYSSSFCHFM